MGLPPSSSAGGARSQNTSTSRPYVASEKMRSTFEIRVVWRNRQASSKKLQNEIPVKVATFFRSLLQRHNILLCCAGHGRLIRAKFQIPSVTGVQNPVPGPRHGDEPQRGTPKSAQRTGKPIESTGGACRHDPGNVWARP